MAQVNKKSRTWVFTLNNYTDVEVSALKSGDFKYICWGYEVGKCGTPHLQGYVEFENARYMRGIKKVKGFERAHLEVRKGTAKEAIVYCAKEYILSLLKEINKDNDSWLRMGMECSVDDPLIKDWAFDNWKKWYMVMDNSLFFCLGEFTEDKGGRRTDLELARELVLANSPLYDIQLQVGYQAYLHARAMYSNRPPSRNWKTKVYWLWGPTGCGKTSTAVDMCGDNRVWISGDNLKWFDGYQMEKYVVIDDFRGHLVDWSFLLRLLDRYPQRVPVKGGYVDWCPEVIFITAPLAPKVLYNDFCEKSGEDVHQLIRRIDEIIYVGPEDV